MHKDTKAPTLANVVSSIGPSGTSTFYDELDNPL